jgi:hypothetical protein
MGAHQLAEALSKESEDKKRFTAEPVNLALLSLSANTGDIYMALNRCDDQPDARTKRPESECAQVCAAGWPKFVGAFDAFADEAKAHQVDVPRIRKTGP